MPTPTYTPLANITLGSSAASVTFSSISQAYRDLVLVVAPIATSTLSFIVRANSDTGSNYSTVYAFGDGSSPQSGSFTSSGFQAAGMTVPTTGGVNFLMNLFDYSTDKHKSALLRANFPSGGVEMDAGRWANTSAVTTLTVVTQSSTFAAGSTFALYGIAA